VARFGTTYDKLAVAAVVGAIAFSFATPPEVTQGNPARLFNLHLPMIAVMYVAFGVTFVASIVYLARKALWWDHLAAAAAEVGVLFNGLTLVVGMLWAKPTWGVYWTWSARLILTAVMFFVYLGYLALRRAIADPELRASRSAVYGILSLIQIPVIHFSVVWWRDVHQQATLLRPDEMQIDGVLFAAFLAGLVAFLMIGASLLRRRLAVASLEAEVERVAIAGSGGVAGDAVTPPALERRSPKVAR
jgi:heme exporter protein C